MAKQDFPRFRNVGTMDCELRKALREGHNEFRLLFRDGAEDDFVIYCMDGDDIELAAEDPHVHKFQRIHDDDVESFITLD